MDADNQLKDTLAITVANAISRIETLKDVSDRRCVFHEYKEWLSQNIDEEVWALPTDWNCQKQA